jgi:hypothetical protein
MLSRAGRHNRMGYTYPNKSVMVPRGLDRPEGMYSTQWDVVYLAEAIESSRDAWEKFGRAMRHRAIPLGAQGWLRPGERQLTDLFGNPRFFRQRIADTNPGNPTHWLNETATPADDSLRLIQSKEQYAALQRWNNRAIVPKTLHRLISCHKDNPAYWDLARWGWTADGYDYVQEELDSMTGHRRYRLRDGLWVAAEGSVFPEFSLRAHVVDSFDIRKYPDWALYVGWDPGFDHPTAILWFAVAPDGDIYIVDEIFEGGRTVAEHCAEVHKRNAGRTVRRYYGDPQEFFSSRSQGTSCAKQALKCGLRFQRWPATGGREEAMVDAVRDLVKNTLRGTPGVQHVYVMRHCVNTIREFQSWSYARTRAGDLPRGKDRFEDRDNHTMDVIKGVVDSGALRVRPGGDDGGGGDEEQDDRSFPRRRAA